MNWRAFIAVGALVCGQQNLLAQIDCGAPPPPCARVGVKSILFTGIVASAGLASDGDSTPQDTRIEVEEIFAGIDPGVKEITVEVEGGWMNRGHSYLVDAFRGADGRLYLGPCGTSGEVTSVADFVDYLRQRAAGKAMTSLGVSVTDRYRWVSGVDVSITGSGGNHVGRTDEDGVATFEGIKPGKYRIAAEGAHYHKDTTFRSNEEVDVLEGTCVRASFGLQSEAALGGIVLDAKGTPTPNLVLQLVRVPEESTEEDLLLPVSEVQSNAGGEFRFDSVSPGRYYLGTNLGAVRVSPVPRTYYPGRRGLDSALPIEVKPGQSVDGLVLKLPDFGVAREIQLCVVDEQGKPIPSAVIRDDYVKEGSDLGGLGGVEARRTTDETGCVKATGYTGVAYAVTAFFHPPGVPGIQMEIPDDFVINPGDGPVHVALTLKPIGRPTPKK